MMFLKKKDLCEIEKQVQTAKDLITNNNRKLDSLIATVNGEEGWMLKLFQEPNPDEDSQEGGAGQCGNTI